MPGKSKTYIVNDQAPTNGETDALDFIDGWVMSWLASVWVQI